MVAGQYHYNTKIYISPTCSFDDDDGGNTHNNTLLHQSIIEDNNVSILYEILINRETKV